MPRPSTSARFSLVDAHVHFYPPYSLERFFDSAARNFSAARRELGVSGGEVAGHLLLAEGDEPAAFARWRHTAERDGAGQWGFRETEESASLVARRDDGETVVVVAGSQLRTADGLEVLALCSAREFEEGRGLRETVRAVRRAGAVPVVPWGFGKWWGRRGRLLRDLIEGAPPGSMMLGDNSGRPRLGPRPRLFRRAGEEGIAVLPGTDPLPFSGEERKVGSFGACLRTCPGLDRPAASLREHLAGLRSVPGRYGTGETVWRFLRHQVAMQLRKRIR